MTAGLLLLLAAAASAGPLTGPEPPPPWVGRTGLHRSSGAWHQVRRHPRRDVEASVRLTEDEVLRLDAFFAATPSTAPWGALARPLLDKLEREGVAPLDTVWFRTGRGGLRLTARGEEAVPAAVLGDAYADRFDWPAPGEAERLFGGPIRLTMPSAAETLAPAGGPDDRFDLASVRPPAPAAAPKPRRPLPPIVLEMGTHPHAIAIARNTESLYHAYGWTADLGIDAATDGPRSAGAITLRLMKMPVDVFLAAAASWIQHESAHMIVGLHTGGTDSGFRPGSGILGLTVHTSGPPWKFDDEELLLRKAAGMHATQAAAAELQRRLLARDRVDWTYLPLYIAHKSDVSGYGLLGNPRVGHVAKGEESYDTVQYVEQYARVSGRDPRDVRRDIVRGAVLNALDPVNLWAVYAYGVKYVILGEQRIENPMIKIGPTEWMAGTGFMLAPNGPWYRGVAYMRLPGCDLLVHAAPSFGDQGQWAMEGGASYKVMPGTELDALGAVWRQRRHAAPGDTPLGGGGALGLSQAVYDGVGIELRGGYKSKGAWLGRQWEEGGFGEGGLRLGF